jgi:3-dehydroquinate dehydratase I
LSLKTMVCIPIMEKDPVSLLKSSKRAIKLGADILEIRIDALQDPDPEKLKSLLQEMGHKLIATNRMQEEGGFFDGSESERTEILLEVAQYSDFIDIELQTKEKYRSEVITASRSSIISFHDFEKTPDLEELLGIVSLERELGEIAKFAVMPKNIQDTLTVLEVLSQVQDTIGIAMGEIGRYTRVVAPLFGSPLTFASLDVESAPGQLDIQTTKNFLSKMGNWRS